MSNLPTEGRILKACPFCGGAADVFFNGTNQYWYGGCLPCDAEGPPCTDAEGAAEMWNSRSLPVEASGDTGQVGGPVDASRTADAGDAKSDRSAASNSCSAPEPAAEQEPWQVRRSWRLQCEAAESLLRQARPYVESFAGLTRYDTAKADASLLVERMRKHLGQPSTKAGES
jgi:hypothetical protein